jgi:Zn-dependent protease with chaperone function
VIRFREQQERSRVATRWLVALFALTVLFTVAGVNAALALAWRLQFAGFLGYPRWFFETNTFVTLLFVLGGAWLEALQLRDGGAHVAKLLGGREVIEPRTALERRLRNVVDEMALASTLPPLRVFVLDREDAINAFAAGWEPQGSVLAVTRGALERLNRDELQGVVAHEFAHILNGDTRLNMRLLGMVYGLQMVFTFGRSLMSPVDERGGRAPTWLAGLALVIAGSVGWFAGRLLKAGVSREREHLADAAAIQFTRLPDGLGNALRKIAAQLERGERLEHVNAEVVSHLLLSSDTLVGTSWLATHPPLAERIRLIFGHDMPPLPDDRLAVDEQDERVAPELPPLAFVAAPVVTTSSPASTQATGSGEDDLQTLDPTLQPAAVQAAVLACLLPVPRGTATWPALPGFALADAQRFVAAVATLPTRARLPWFERLVALARELPPDRRSALVHAARELAQAGGRVSLREYLRIAVLQRQLADDHALPPPHEHLGLSELAATITAASLDLATLLPQAQRRAWVDAVLLALALPPLPDGEVTPRPLNGVLDRLALLAPVQRPALVKAWLAAAGPASSEFAEALALVCLLIDTPRPPGLQAQFDAPAVASVQQS